MISPPGPALPPMPRPPHGARAPSVARYEAAQGDSPGSGAAQRPNAGGGFAAATSAFLAQLFGQSPPRAARPEAAAGAYRMQDAAEIAPRRFKTV